ncbi:MAG: DUF427 domain-containing protein [Caulobacteraceae bacterium]|nr:DUF427 domain-containing protein [Caulobacteraceae bacterium]
MTTKSVRIPGPDHPISIAPQPGRVRVRVGDRVVADTRAALSLKEASYPAVLYIPRGDVDLALLERTEHSTWCPYKGDASYYSIPSGGDRSVNAIWTYEAAYPSVAEIEGHMAFYPDRVDAIEVEAEA